MKNILKSSLSIILAITIIFSSAYVGLSECDLSGVFVIETKAASESDLTFDLEYSYEYNTSVYFVTDCNTSASGEMVIPEKHDGIVVGGISSFAFQYCSELTSIRIPDGVQSIGAGAFSFCSGLTSITIPELVGRIENSAFDNCSNLWWIGVDSKNYHYSSDNGVLFDKNKTTLVRYPEGKTATSYVIPDSVTSVEEAAFENCTNLTSIIIPDSVTSIGLSAFFGCTNLTSITIPDSVTSIGEMAFDNTAYYNDISNWVNEVLYIGNHIVKAQKSISGNYTVDSSTKNIADCAFENCTSLVSITMPNSVTSIGNEAFNYCTSLIEITIPSSLTSIGASAFYRCQKLTSVTIPDSVTSIGDYAFWGCESLCKVQWNAKRVADFRASSNVFYDAGTESSGIELEFGDTVEVIPAYLCYVSYSSFAPKITSVTMEDNLISIGAGAFKRCTSLSSITIPSSITSIGESTFDGCTSLASITIPKSVTSIGDSAFNGCTSLTSVTIPNSVTSIGDSAFMSCISLSKIQWNAKNIEDFSYSADVFYNAGTSGSGIEMVFGDTVERIPGHLFSVSNSAYAPNVKSVTLSNSIKSVGGSAFGSIKSVYITDIKSWCEINFDTFYSNPMRVAETIYLNGDVITDIIIPEGITKIGNYAFLNCKSLTSVTIPDSVTSIGDSAFNGCTQLDLISIPDSVTSIGTDTFKGCAQLTTITIHDSVKSIGWDAFEGCESLESVYITDIKAWCEIDFYGSLSNPMCYADAVYWNGELITEVSIPKGKTKIDDYTFLNWKSLTSVTIPDSVTSIGRSAFDGCIQLDSISIPDSVTSIGVDTFKGCAQLTAITIPDSVTSIGERAFSGCVNLSKILWNSKSIGDFLSHSNVFYNAGTSGSGIKLIFGDTVKVIPAYLCYSSDSSCAPNLKSVTIPGSVTTIGKNAFANCENIKDVNITDIASWCAISFGNVYGNPVFYAKNLKLNGNEVKNLTIPGNVSSIGRWAFYNLKTLETISLPDCITDIGYSAFNGCSNLKSVTIPNGVTTVSEHTFEYCTSLVSVTIPDSVTSIGEAAFKNCTSLTDVNYIGSKSAWLAVSIGADNTNLTNASVYCGLRAPVLNAAVCDSDGIQIAWETVNGAQGYYIYRLNNYGTWVKMATVESGVQNYFIDSTVKSGRNYSYTVQAYKDNYVSTYDTTGVSSFFLSVPKLRKITGSSTGITVNWAEVEGANGYYIYRKVNNGSWVKYATVKGSTFKYTDKNIKSGKTYTYSVCAYNENTISYYNMNGISLYYLSAPKLKTVSNISNGVKITWNKVTGADSYTVYRKTGSGSWKKIAENVKTTSYTDKTAKKGVNYKYTVKAKNEAGLSGYNTKGLSIKRLTTPTLKSVSSAKAGVTFKWNKVTGASGYIVYRKTGNGSWKEIATVKGNTKVTYLDKTAKKGKTYKYTVKAYYGSSESAYNTNGLKIKDKY